jgi:hypothetical protein
VCEGKDISNLAFAFRNAWKWSFSYRQRSRYFIPVEGSLYIKFTVHGSGQVTIAGETEFCFRTAVLDCWSKWTAEGSSQRHELFLPTPAAVAVPSSTPSPPLFYPSPFPLTPPAVVYCHSQIFISLRNWFHVHEAINDDGHHNSGSGAVVQFGPLSSTVCCLPGHYPSCFCIEHISEPRFCLRFQIERIQYSPVHVSWQKRQPKEGYIHQVQHKTSGRVKINIKTPAYKLHLTPMLLHC